MPRPDKNRLAEDADKRVRLRADGTVVFQLNWDDVDDDGRRNRSARTCRGRRTRATRRRARGRRTRSRAATRPNCPGSSGRNPVRTLFAFLSDPDRRGWLRRAEAAVAGLSTSPPRVSTSGDIDRTDRWRLFWDSCLPRRGRPGRAGAAVTDDDGCAVTVILDPRARDEENRPRRYGPRSPSSTTGWRRSWRIRRRIVAAGRRGCTGGTSSSSCPTGPVTASRSPTRPGQRSTRHAAGGRAQGRGLLRAAHVLLAEPAQPGGGYPWAASLAADLVCSPVGVDVSWPVDLLAPEVGPLAHRLAELGVPAPRPGPGRLRAGRPGMAGGGRLGRSRGSRSSPDGDEECVAAFAAAGWDARLAGDWPPEELAARIMGGDSMSGQVAAARQADKEIDKLARAVKGAMWDFMRKFRQDPSSPGLQFKQLKGDSRLYSARVSDDYRALHAAREGRRVHARRGQAPQRVLRQPRPVRLPDQPGHRRHRVHRHGLTRRDRQAAARQTGPAAAVRRLLAVAADRAGRAAAAAADDREDHDRGAAARVRRVRRRSSPPTYCSPCTTAPPSRRCWSRSPRRSRADGTGRPGRLRGGG